MSYLRSTMLMGATALCALAQTSQFTPEIRIDPPKPIRFVQPILRPFNVQKPTIGPADLTNSPRIDALIRSGNMYLSADDVIALALENNLDIAIQRYGAYLYKASLKRTESGAAPRNFSVPIAQVASSVSTAGVTVGSVGAAGGGAGVASGGGLIPTIGVTPPSLDPVFSASTSFMHSSIPESVQTVSFTSALITDSRSFSTSYSQAWTTGTSAMLDFAINRYDVNSPANVLNPYTTGVLDFQVSQQLLQGWGRAVNNRYIRIAKNNIKVNDLNFKLQVITTISGVLNLYWDLVSFDEDLRIKEKALETAQQLLEDNKHQAELGTLPQIEVTRAEAQVSQSKEDLLISQTNVAQQEVILKNALSRTGSVSGLLDDVHIVPLDHIVVPDREDLKATSELIDDAISARPDIQYTKINLDTAKIAVSGTKSNLLPTLTAFADTNNAGLSGSVNPASLPFAALVGVADPVFVGGTGNVFAQIFRRNYPNYSAGFSLNIPFRNRAAQADYVADMLGVRQNELQLQKAMNDVRVQVKNAVVNLQQARARYETSVATRVLGQQTLEAEQMRFKFGESTIANVVQAQRDLATDQTGEIQAMANYTHAKINFDEAMGQTLDVNRISIGEATSGHVARPSTIPENFPAPVSKQGGAR